MRTLITKEILKKNHKNYLYDKRLQQIMHVIKDKAYWENNGSLYPTTAYMNFVNNMKKAIIEGRTISSKMSDAMKSIVLRYLDATDPKKIKKRTKGAELLLEKINKVGASLSKAGYSSDYTSGALNFLNSVTKQAKIRGTITNKQKLALNKMYKRFNKRIEAQG